MEIRRDTFEEGLQKLQQSLKKADFIAVDCEFTGVSLETDPLHLFRPPRDKYAAARDVCVNCQLMQVGVCPVHWDNKLHKYIAEPYSIHVFPAPPGYFRDRCFVSQVGSMRFMAEHGFDFNKLFRHGVPYTNFAEEMQCQDNTDQRRASHRTELKLPSINRPHDHLFLQDARTRLTALTQSLGKGDAEADSKTQPMEVDGDAEEDDVPDEPIEDTQEDEVLQGASVPNSVLLTPDNGFQRLLVHRLVELEFSDFGVVAEDNPIDEKRKFLRVLPMTADERKERDEREVQERARKFAQKQRKAAGARRVFEALVAARKPIVGHNMLLDLMYMFQSFFYELPESYDLFKFAVHRLFPTIYDVRYIAMNPPFSNDPAFQRTNVAPIKEALLRSLGEPAVTKSQDKAFANGNVSEHDAANDALDTALNFAGLCMYWDWRQSTGGAPSPPAPLSQASSHSSVTPSRSNKSQRPTLGRLTETVLSWLEANRSNRLPLYLKDTHIRLDGVDDYMVDLSHLFFCSAGTREELNDDVVSQYFGQVCPAYTASLRFLPSSDSTTRTCFVSLQEVAVLESKETASNADKTAASSTPRPSNPSTPTTPSTAPRTPSAPFGRRTPSSRLRSMGSRPAKLSIQKANDIAQRLVANGCPFVVVPYVEYVAGSTTHASRRIPSFVRWRNRRAVLEPERLTTALVQQLHQQIRESHWSSVPRSSSTSSSSSSSAPKRKRDDTANAQSKGAAASAKRGPAAK